MSDRFFPEEWPEPEVEPRVIRVIRPADGSLVGELAVTPSHDIPRRVARARSVQEGWASLEPRDRARRLEGLVEAIGSRAREIEGTIVAETGKPRAEAMVEIITVLDLLRFYRKRAPGFLEARSVPSGWLLWKGASVTREPLGVIGVISPWNYPFILSMTPVVTALFGGNAAILKPSEYTPYSGLFAEDLARDAGLPEGLVQVVVGMGATGEALVRSGVDKVFFTGGSETGRKVLASAAESLTPAVVELGGKDASIVLEDANLERAARGIVWGAFQNAGQACIGVERVFVVDDVFEAFLRQVLDEVRRIRADSTAGVDVGPMVVPEQLDKVEEQLREAVEGGGKVVAGGHRVDPASNVLRPTVLVDIPETSAVLEEETFGPLLPLVRVKDADEAVRRTNSSRYGLSASIWTGDRRRGVKLGKRLKVGGVTVNDTLVHYGIPSLPFGGVGESGFGRARGLEGLGELTRTHSTVIDRLGLEREPWWFPYSKVTEMLLWATLLFRWKGGFRGLLSATVALLKRRRG
jgi:succinate-semialdehyde dehydrogenase/glutarate-semialdehyde dehydrogenase